MEGRRSPNLGLLGTTLFLVLTRKGFPVAMATRCPVLTRRDCPALTGPDRVVVIRAAVMSGPEISHVVVVGLVDAVIGPAVVAVRVEAVDLVGLAIDRVIVAAGGKVRLE